MPEDIEKLIRRYRPVGPPPGLRGRVIGRRSSTADWAWPAAAAALAVVTVLLRAGASNAMLTALQPVDAAPQTAIVQALAASLESEEHAYVLAETIVLQERVRAAHAGTPETSNPGRSNQ